MSTELTPTMPITLTPVESGDAPPEELSATQITALAGLLAGKSVVDAAEAAGVGRTTIYKWLRNDFAFQAAVNRGRRGLRQSVALRVEQLAADAAECVAQAVRNGNVKAAMEILRRTDMLAPPKIGSDDEEQLAIEHQEQMEKRADRVALAGLRRRLLPGSAK